MKKTILLLFSLLLMTPCFAQDIIILKNGDEIKSLVTEVLTHEIKYKKFENKQGPSYVVDKAKVFMIRYANGSKDVFNESSKSSNSPQKQVSTQSNYRQVQPIRQTYYRPKPTCQSHSYYEGGGVRSMLFGGVQLPTGYFADGQSVGFFLGDETDIRVGGAGFNVSLNGTFNYFLGKDSYYYYGTSYMFAKVLTGVKFVAPVSATTDLYPVAQGGVGIGFGEGTSTQFNFSIGAGATFNQHFDVSVRFNGASSSTDYYYIYPGPNSFAFCFGYKF